MRRQVTAGGSCIFLCVCHSETPLFLSLKINQNIFGVASYTKMLTLLETCSARRLLDLILRYAPNKVKRGFAPAVCGQLPTLRGARGQAPCTPKIAPTTPKSVTKHKAPIGGCRSTPLWKRKKRELFSSLFSLSLRQSLGHTSVLSERDGDCLCSGQRKECCYSLPHTQHSFLHPARSP